MTSSYALKIKAPASGRLNTYLFVTAWIFVCSMYLSVNTENCIFHIYGILSDNLIDGKNVQLARTSFHRTFIDHDLAISKLSFFNGRKDSVL
jgi:hypothetical protein